MGLSASSQCQQSISSEKILSILKEGGDCNIVDKEILGALDLTERILNFTNCIFKKNLLLSNTKFTGEVIFINCKFKKEVDFSKTKFLGCSGYN